MKNLLMIFFFVAGIAVSTANAQNCTPKQVAECKMAPCASACKGSTASASVQPVGVVALASFTPEAISASCLPANASEKDIKACQAKCTGNTASLMPGGTSVSAPQGCTPAPASQVKVASQASPAPVCAAKPIKQ
jgi:hypothetical protein